MNLVEQNFIDVCSFITRYIFTSFKWRYLLLEGRSIEIKDIRLILIQLQGLKSSYPCRAKVTKQNTKKVLDF